MKFSSYAKIHELPDPRPKHHYSPSAFGWRVLKTVKTTQLLRDFKVLEHHAAVDAGAINALGCDAVLLHLCCFTNAPLLLKYLRTTSFWFCQEPTRSLFDTSEQLLDTGMGFCDRAYRRKLRSVEISCAKAAGTILCNSAFSREFILRSYGAYAVVCRLGVDTAKFVSSNVPKKNQVICWGPLWPDKGLDFIIRSVARIPLKQRPKVMFPWIRGSDDYRAELETVSKGLGVDIDLPKGLSDKDLLILIHESKVCVYAPHLEPLGLVPLEAMVAGLPVVGVREGGVRETVLDGVTGFLCGRNENEFADRILTLLEDDGFREQMGSDAAAYVRREWTWGQTITH